jgi:DNA-directed RNA polymerase specialized sigma24 family protein
MDYIVKNNERDKPKRKYFTKDCENAIVKYNNTSNIEEKNLIYEQSIHYPFYKLTQNIIHTFKFHHMDEPTIEDLQHKVILFLIDKLHGFKPENGAKAYSYFGTITKRFLIDYNRKQYKSKIQNSSLPEESTDLANVNKYMGEEMELNMDELAFEGFKEKDKLYLFVDLYVEFCTENLEKIFKKTDEQKIADAILELFRKRNQIEIFNKKALYFNIREIYPESSSIKITKISKILNKIFKKNYNLYLSDGYLNFKI